MADSLRRGYNDNRKLIESSRLLTPTFADGVLYFTGAQVELMRNLMAYANQRETFVDDYESGYYTMPDNDDWDDILAIVADLEEVLMGNPNTLWGYKDRYYENLDYLALTTYILKRSVAVPANQVYMLQAACLKLQDRATTSAVMQTIVSSSSACVLAEAATLAANTWLFWVGNVVLKEGDQIQLYVNGCQADDIFQGRVWGYKMDVP